MISEVSFAKGFLSFWDTVIPYMKQYMKICNLDLESFEAAENIQFF